MRDLNAPPAGKISVKVELLFQFERLVTRVRRPLSLRFTHTIDAVCNKQQQKQLGRLAHLELAKKLNNSFVPLCF